MDLVEEEEGTYLGARCFLTKVSSGEIDGAGVDVSEEQFKHWDGNCDAFFLSSS